MSSAGQFTAAYLPIEWIFGIVIDVLQGIIRHPDWTMSIASVFQDIQLVAKLILGIIVTSRIAKDPTGTPSNVGLASGIDVMSGGRLKRVRGVGRIHIDAVGTVMSVEFRVSR